AVELLVPPVADAADSLSEQQAGRDGIHKEADVRAGALHDLHADERAEEDAAPHAQAALPHLEDALPLWARHLVPGGDVVVGARADDAETDAPDRDACDEIPVAAERDPTLSAEPHAREDRNEQREPVHVELERPQVHDTGVRRRDVREQAHAPTLSAPPADLAQDVGRDLRGAALLQQLDRDVEIDVGARCELGRHARGIACPLELLSPPPLDELLFRRPDVGVGFRSWHRRLSCSYPIFIRYNAGRGSPHAGGYADLTER